MIIDFSCLGKLQEVRELAEKREESERNIIKNELEKFWIGKRIEIGRSWKGTITVGTVELQDKKNGIWTVMLTSKTNGGLSNIWGYHTCLIHYDNDGNILNEGDLWRFID